MEKLTNWEENYLGELAKLKNQHVLHEVIMCHLGDLWDGMSSKQNTWKLSKAEEELKKRLKLLGFYEDETDKLM